MTDQQLIHKANGIKRIKQAIANCDLPVSEIGTMFKSEPKINKSYEFTFELDDVDSEIINSLSHLFRQSTITGITDLGSIYSAN